MYKTGKLEITADVRAKPLRQKRKQGRPAKITLPATALPAEVPILVLSPSVPSIASSSQSPSIVSHLTPAPLFRSTRHRRKVFFAEHERKLFPFVLPRVRETLSNLPVELTDQRKILTENEK